MRGEFEISNLKSQIVAPPQLPGMPGSVPSDVRAGLRNESRFVCQFTAVPHAPRSILLDEQLAARRPLEMPSSTPEPASFLRLTFQAQSRSSLALRAPHPT